MGTNRSDNIQSEIEILKSRPLMTRVVKKLNLQYSYTAKGRIKDQNVYKQAPFTLEAFELADSARPFSITINFINERQFHVNNENKNFEFEPGF